MSSENGAQRPEPMPTLPSAAAARSPSFRPRVVVADDDGAMRDLLASVLRHKGYEVLLARSGEELLGHLEPDMAHPGPGMAVGTHGIAVSGSSSTPSSIGAVACNTVIVSDIRMPMLDGLGVLCRLRELGSRLPIILITAFGDAETHELARSLGATAVIDKPFELEHLVAAVGRAAQMLAA